MSPKNIHPENIKMKSIILVGGKGTRLADERKKIDDLRQRLNITEEDALAIIGYLQSKNDQK